MPTEDLPRDGVIEGVHQDDPYDWSVDQVVSALCDPESPFLHGKQRAQIPDLPLLERSIRDNDVDGNTLLTGVGGQELKDDLGIKKLGPRTTILNAIRMLQVRSAKYHQLASEFGLPSSPLDLQRLTTPFSRHTSVAFFGAPSITQSPVQHAQNGRGRSQSISNQSVVTSHAVNGLTFPFRVPEQSKISSGLDQPPPSSFEIPTQPLTQTTTPIGQLDEISTDAIDHRKPTSKRQIPEVDLSNSDVEILPDAGTLPDAVKPSLGPIQHSNVVAAVDGGRKRRKVEPQSVAVGLTAVRDRRFDVPVANGHAEDDSLAPDVFFSADQSQLFEDPEEFTITGQTNKIGPKLYRNKLMKYFFRQPKHRLGTHDGKDCTAVIPYSHRLVRGQPHYITVFVTDLQGVTVRKDPLSDWPDLEEEVLGQQNDPRSNEAEAGFKAVIQWDKPKNETDFLKPADEAKAFWARFDKYHEKIKPDGEAEDCTLPIFGDSDSEDAYDSEEERDFKESKAEAPKIGPLSKEGISKAVDEAIERMVEKWKSERLPRIETKAWKVWRKSRRDNNKNLQIREAQTMIAHSDTRLNVLRGPIENDTWPTVKDINRACRALEGHIEDREESRWKIRILELDKCPPKPPKTDRPKRIPSRPPSLADGEELLERESVVSSDDSMDDFIDDEEVVPGPVSPTAQAEANFADVEDVMEMDNNAPKTPEPEKTSEDEIITPQSQKNAIFSHVEIVLDSRKHLSTPSAENSPARPPSGTTEPPLTSRKGKIMDVIDLTISSQESSKESRRGSDGTISGSRRLKLIHKEQPSSSGFRTPRFSYLLENDSSHDSASSGGVVDSFSFSDIKKQDWHELELSGDRKRLLIKLFLEMEGQSQKSLAVLIEMSDQPLLRRYIQLGLKAIRDNKKQLEGYSPQISLGSINAAMLWTSWATTDSLQAYKDRSLSPALVDSALKHKNGFPAYATFLKSMLKSYGPLGIGSTPQKGSPKKLGRKDPL
jgi:hypothetical protein